MPRRDQPIGRRHIRRDPPTNVARQAGAIFPWAFDHADGAHALKRLERVYTDTLASMDSFDDRVAEISKNDSLSEKGRRQAVFNFAAGNVAPALKRGRVEVFQARKDLEAQRAKLSTPPIDKSDFAAALVRQEIRQRIREMQPSERAMLSVGAPDETLDPMVAAAILEAPAHLSGFSDDAHRAVRDRSLREMNGDAVAEVDELAAAIEQVEDVLTKVHRAVVTDVAPDEADQKRFNEAVSAAGSSVVWLRKKGAEVHVVDLESLRQRPATLDEIKRGQFFDTAEAYNAAKAAI